MRPFFAAMVVAVTALPPVATSQPNDPSYRYLECSAFFVAMAVAETDQGDKQAYARASEALFERAVTVETFEYLKVNPGWDLSYTKEIVLNEHLRLRSELIDSVMAYLKHVDPVPDGRYRQDPEVVATMERCALMAGF